MRRALLLLALTSVVIAAAAAHGSDERATLTVYAASSLTNVLPRIDSRERYSFGGSDALAAQIEQGAPADVFAAANLALPRELYTKGIVTRPRVLTRNALVLIVPRRNPAHIHHVSDVTRRGVKLVVAGPSVPAGVYTLVVLSSLHLRSALHNVVSRETDVRGVLAKVALGEADAGFVYATDARTVRSKITVIPIPARGQPVIDYGIAVVRASRHKAAAAAYVAKLLGEPAQKKLQAAGFLRR